MRWFFEMQICLCLLTSTIIGYHDIRTLVGITYLLCIIHGFICYPIDSSLSNSCEELAVQGAPGSAKQSKHALLIGVLDEQDEFIMLTPRRRSWQHINYTILWLLTSSFRVGASQGWWQPVLALGAGRLGKDSGTRIRTEVTHLRTSTDWYCFCSTNATSRGE